MLATLTTMAHLIGLAQVADHLMMAHAAAMRVGDDTLDIAKAYVVHADAFLAHAATVGIEATAGQVTRKARYHVAWA